MMNTSFEDIKAAVERMSYEDQARLASWLYSWTDMQRDRMQASPPTAPLDLGLMPAEYFDMDIDDYRL